MVKTIHLDVQAKIRIRKTALDDETEEELIKEFISDIEDYEIGVPTSKYENSLEVIKIKEVK